MQLTLLRLILEHIYTGIYLHELQDKLYDIFGMIVSASVGHCVLWGVAGE